MTTFQRLVLEALLLILSHIGLGYHTGSDREREKIKLDQRKQINFTIKNILDELKRHPVSKEGEK